MKKISEEIVKGKNLNENLPVYARYMMGVYKDFSFIRLSMNYFTYYEMMQETDSRTDILNEITASLNNIIRKIMLEKPCEEELTTLIEQTDSLRNKVINIMEGVTSYTDIFNIYEYCLNRIEYKYNDGSEFLRYDDDKLTAEFLRYVLSSQDKVVINSKIAELVRQLPIRMTKGRFFELLKEGIKVYRGSEVSTVEDFLYMLKTVAAVSETENTEFLSEEILEIYKRLKNVKFSELTENQYRDLREKLSIAIEYIIQHGDMYILLGELLNDLYVVLMSFAYVKEESKDTAICNDIIKKVNNLFDNQQVTDDYSYITDSFVKLEGRQEVLHGKFSAYEYVIEEVLNKNKKILNDLMLQEEYDSLKKITLLESGSVFVEFKEKNRNEADDKYIEQVTEQFIAELSELFKNNERLVNRAVMAHVLSELPVFFNNIDEIKDYIYNALSGCRDEAEKAAVVEILMHLKAEDN